MKKNYLFDPIVIHTIVATASLFISAVAIFLSIKFLGFYFLLFNNRPFIEISGAYNISLVFIAPIIIIDISLAIIMIAFTVIKINFNEIEKKLTSNKSHSHLLINMGELYEKNGDN